MAFSNDQKASIRKYMGMSRLFRDSNPILESAIIAIEQMNDGGATEDQMKVSLTALDVLDGQIAVSRQLTLASEVQGEIKVDAARQLAVLRKEGTAMINGLSFPLSMPPAKRYFYPEDAGGDDFILHGSGQSRKLGW